jgi:hypothetical protein
MRTHYDYLSAPLMTGYRTTPARYFPLNRVAGDMCLERAID